MLSGARFPSRWVLRCTGESLNSLAPKLVLTPLLIASATLAGRRWGGARSGWLVALPLTSGPIVLFVAMDQGSGLAAEVASGALAGSIAVTAFCLTYAHVSRATGWPLALAASLAAFAAVSAVLPAAPVLLVFALAIVLAAIALRALPKVDGLPRTSIGAPRWDIPVRILVASVLVLGVTALAPIVGGRLSGIVATVPIYVAVLATFAHRTIAHEEAVAILRGVLFGLMGFSAFYLVLATSLVPLGVVLSFAAAIAAVIVVHGVTLRLLGNPTS